MYYETFQFKPNICMCNFPLHPSPTFFVTSICAKNFVRIKFHHSPKVFPYLSVIYYHLVMNSLLICVMKGTEVPQIIFGVKWSLNKICAVHYLFPHHMVCYLKDRILALPSRNLRIIFWNYIWRLKNDHCIKNNKLNAKLDK